ncbi:MAG TPA: EAL domain-containing protein [Terriglobales bacterium]|nr:EAL domain-containing protein [Terriglobales bacterium]
MQSKFKSARWLSLGITALAILATGFVLRQLWGELGHLHQAQLFASRLEAHAYRLEWLRTQARQRGRGAVGQELRQSQEELRALLQAADRNEAGPKLAPFRTAIEGLASGTDASDFEHHAKSLAQLHTLQQSMAADASLTTTLAKVGSIIGAFLVLALLGQVLSLMRLHGGNGLGERQRDSREQHERRFRRLTERSSDVVAIVSPEGVIEYVSGGVENVLGYSPSSGLGKNIFLLMHPDEITLGRQLLSALASAPGSSRTEHFRYRHPYHGAWRTLEVVVRNELLTEGIHGIVVNAQDVTERIQASERFRHEAFHDPLTGLPNRAFFMERLQHAVNRARRDPTYQFATLFLDVDRFKLVNDSFGYGAGNALLRAFAARLRLCVQQPVAQLGTGQDGVAQTREQMLARVGGDEFCILLDEMQQASHAIRLAERILLRLKDSFLIEEADVFTSASIGVAVSTPHYVSAEEVLRDADIAMYRAKLGGGARLELFDSAMHEQVLRQLRLETDLRRALDRREFEVVFQPIVVLDDCQLEGVEALIRWRHPQRGLISPGEFISVAESTGLIVPLGRWMLQESCRQFQSLQGEMGAPRTLSVNFSAQEFSQADLVEQVEQALSASGVCGSCLHVEITESTMMTNVEQISDMLLALKALGVRISIDDFGTGYSSLSYLRRLPIDALKIDRSFVLGMQADQESREIVHTILALARNLGLQTIAEGAETPEQVAQLKSMQCTYGQGFYFSKPVSLEMLRQRLRYWPCEAPAATSDEGQREMLLAEVGRSAVPLSPTNQRPRTSGQTGCLTVGERRGLRPLRDLHVK